MLGENTFMWAGWLQRVQTSHFFAGRSAAFTQLCKHHIIYFSFPQKIHFISIFLFKWKLNQVVGVHVQTRSRFRCTQACSYNAADDEHTFKSLQLFNVDIFQHGSSLPKWIWRQAHTKTLTCLQHLLAPQVLYQQALLFSFLQEHNTLMRKIRWDGLLYLLVKLDLSRNLQFSFVQILKTHLTGRRNGIEEKCWNKRLPFSRNNCCYFYIPHIPTPQG